MPRSSTLKARLAALEEGLATLHARLDHLAQRLDGVSYEVRHGANLRFDQLDKRAVELQGEIGHLRQGLEETRGAVVEATVHLTRALRDATEAERAEEAAAADPSR